MKGNLALRKKDLPSERGMLSTASIEPAKLPAVGTQLATKQDQASRKQPGRKAQPLDAQAAVVRVKKIERIAKEVADGSYKVSSAAVADKLIDYMLEK